MKTFLQKIQRNIGATRSEVVFVAVLLLGMSVGVLVKYSGYHKQDFDALLADKASDYIAHIVDSLGAAEITTFTGTTPNADAVETLAKADTVVKRVQRFPTAPKKITSGKIHLNTASVQQLMTLPGVGEATAQKIAEYRTTHKFSRIEDIMRIKGIGVKKFKAMKEFLDL